MGACAPCLGTCCFSRAGRESRRAAEREQQASSGVRGDLFATFFGPFFSSAFGILWTAAQIEKECERTLVRGYLCLVLKEDFTGPRHDLGEDLHVGCWGWLLDPNGSNGPSLLGMHRCTDAPGDLVYLSTPNTRER